MVNMAAFLKEPADEHAISILPVVLNRNVIMHTAFIESQQFTTVSATGLPVQLAFYDGLSGGLGYNKAVVFAGCGGPSSS